MLVKKELLSIPVGEPPEGEWKEQEASVVAISRLPRSGRILSIDIFRREERRLFCRFFTDAKAYIVFFPAGPHQKSPVWRQCGLESAFGRYQAAASDGAGKTVYKFLKKSLPEWHYATDNPIHEADSFIQAVNREKRWKAAMQRETLKQKHFAMFPDYPKGLERYCEDTVFPRSYLFFDKLIHGRRRVICGRCGHEFEVDAPVRRGQEGTCPRCKRMARYHQLWHETSICEKAKVCIAHRHEGQLLMRFANVERTYRDGKPQYQFDDYFRTLYLNQDGKQTIYSYQWMSIMHYGYDWYRKKNGRTCADEAFIYTGNLRQVFGRSYYNIDLAEMARKAARPMAFVPILDNLKNFPQTEYLVKLGLFRLAECVPSLYLGDGRGFAQLMEVSKQYLPLYQRFDVSLSEHRLIQAAKEWISAEDFQRYRALKVKDPYFDPVPVLEKMSFKKFLNYFEKQKQWYPKESLTRLTGWYKDYIQMSEELRVDLRHKSVRWPKDVREAHDRILVRYHEKEDQILQENLAHTLELLDKGIAEFCTKKFQILIPTCRADFIREGQSLNHCVGQTGYFQRHIEGKRMVFFIRRTETPETPFFTMEVDMQRMRILQLYGYHDCIAPSEVRKFAEQFLRNIKPKQATSAA